MNQMSRNITIRPFSFKGDGMERRTAFMVINTALQITVALQCSVAFLPANAAGNCYQPRPVRYMVENKIEPVCILMANNLNEFCNEPPLVCDLKIHAKYKNVFKLPNWRPVKIDDTLSFIENLIKIPWKNSHDPMDGEVLWNEKKQDISIAIKERGMSISTADLDIYHTGIISRIYRYDYGDCELISNLLHSRKYDPMKFRFSTPRKIIKFDEHSYDEINKKYNVIQNSGPGTGEIFFYKNRTFFYYMMSYEGEGEDLVDNVVIIDQGESLNRSSGKNSVTLVPACEIFYRQQTGEK